MIVRRIGQGCDQAVARQPPVRFARNPKQAVFLIVLSCGIFSPVALRRV